LKLLSTPEPSAEALRQIKQVVMSFRRYAETAGDSRLQDLLDKVDVSIQENGEDGLGMYGAGVMW